MRFKAGELRPELRAAVEAILGQKLGDADTVRVGAEKEPGSEHQEFWDRFAEDVRELQCGNPEDEVELAKLVDEVIHEMHSRSE